MNHTRFRAALLASGVMLSGPLQSTSVFALERVEIVGQRETSDWDGISYVPEGFGGGPVGFGEGIGGGVEVEVAAVDPTKSPDARCNPLATAATKATTSTAPSESRYAAAQQLYTAISARNGGTGAAAIGRSPQYNYYGTMRPTFTMTYADGGSERWVVSTLVPPALIIDANVPGSLKEGSGEATACPSSPAA